ncbi:MAG: hypothetical protein CMM93_07055 [Rickettsiales bacterium]|nr:hypothetical protein [Rickettsiales bacterium]
MKVELLNQTGSVISIRESSTKKTKEIIETDQIVNVEPSDNIYQFDTRKDYMIIKLYGSADRKVGIISAIIPLPRKRDSIYVIVGIRDNNEVRTYNSVLRVGSIIDLPETQRFVAVVGLGECSIRNLEFEIKPLFFTTETISNRDGLKGTLKISNDINQHFESKPKKTTYDGIQMFGLIMLFVLLIAAIISIAAYERKFPSGNDREFTNYFPI